MNKKDVLFLMGSLGGGGAEVVLIDLLRNFPRDKYNVTLLVRDVFEGQDRYFSQVPDWVETIVLNTKKHKLGRLLLNHMPSIQAGLLKRRLNKALGSRKFDAIISWCEGPTAKMHAQIMDRGRKNITWVHTNLSVNHWTSWCYKNNREERDLYARMDEIVFVSQGAKEAFEKMFDLHGNLHVIYNVIDRNGIIAKSQATEVKKEKFTIINIGRLDRQKRQDRIIKVAKILKQRGHDFEVWILGVGKLENQLKEMAERVGVSDRVKFLGFQKNPYPYLKTADMFLLTSDTEGYPTVICEALCLGKPIVSTRITGSEELLGDGSGILTGFDVKEIADRVEDVMSSQDLMRSLSREAECKGKEFNPEEIVGQIKDLIEK